MQIPFRLREISAPVNSISDRIEPTAPEPFGPLAARMRFLGLATGILLVLAWIGNFAPWDDLLDRQGTPLGGDFPMFYLGGQIVADGAVDRLYDMNEHHRRLRLLFPSLGKEDLLPYRYPPFVAGATSLIARLPYGWSWGCFAGLSIALAAFSGIALLKLQPARTTLLKGAAIALCGWPVAVEVIIGGQASFVALAIALGTMLLLARQKEVAAGAILAGALYKPNVLILFVIGALFRYPRMLWGFAPMAVLLGLCCVATAGWEGCEAYLQLGQSLVQSQWDVPTPFWKVHGLVSWLDCIVPAFARPLVFAGGLAATGLWLVSSYRRKDATNQPSEMKSPELAYLLLLNVLFNPYPPIYDLVLLAVPAWFALHAWEAKWRTAVQESGIAVPRWASVAVALAAASFFFGPHFSQGLAFRLQGQVFTVALLAWAGWQGWQLFHLPKRRPIAAVEQKPILVVGAGN